MDGTISYERFTADNGVVLAAEAGRDGRAMIHVLEINDPACPIDFGPRSLFLKMSELHRFIARLQTVERQLEAGGYDLDQAERQMRREDREVVMERRA